MSPRAGITGTSGSGTKWRLFEGHMWSDQMLHPALLQFRSQCNRAQLSLV